MDIKTAACGVRTFRDVKRFFLKLIDGSFEPNLRKRLVLFKEYATPGRPEYAELLRNVGAVFNGTAILFIAKLNAPVDRNVNAYFDALLTEVKNWVSGPLNHKEILDYHQ